MTDQQKIIDTLVTALKALLKDFDAPVPGMYGAKAQALAAIAKATS